MQTQISFGIRIRPLACTVILLTIGFWVVNPAHSASVEQLSALKLALHTGNPITVAEKGREDQFYFEASNPDRAAQIRVRLHLTMTDYDGRDSESTSGVLALAPGATVKVPLGEVIPGIGWWRIRPTIYAVEGDASAVKPTRDLAYIEPVGPRDMPPENGFWFGLDSRVRTPEMLRLFAQMGVDILRFGTWAKVNPDQDEWNWEEFDRVVDEMRDNKMQPLYSVVFTPPYAIKHEYRGKGDPSRLPPRSDALQTALREIIQHTRDKGATVYDLWNEPDHRGFWRGNTEDYLEFMRVAYQTIKNVQPDATVLSGGIASLHQGPADSLNPDMDRRMIVDGQRWYDAIALHEHGTLDRFTTALNGPLTEYRKQLDADKGLWFTETGIDTGGHDKAAGLVQKFTHARAHGAEGLIWYALYAPGQGGGYNIIDAQGDPQPVIPAYNHMVRMMRGKRFDRSLKDVTQSGNQLFAFAGQRQNLFIAWGKGATSHRAPIVLAEGTAAQAFDIMGCELKLERSANTVYLPFSQTPRYLMVHGKAEVGTYEKITPVALFEFGGLEPSATAQHVSVSPIEMVGWSRQNANDRDPRMAGSTSGNPNAMLDGEGDAMQLSFTVTPVEAAAVDIESLSFWGNSGAFNGTTVSLTYRLADSDLIAAGSRELRNLSSPRTKGEYYSFPLRGLEDVQQSITFTLTARSNGQRVILKIDDLRLDGLVNR